MASGWTTGSSTLHLAIRYLVGHRRPPVSLDVVIQVLAPVIRGWGQYFTISQHGEYHRLDA